MTEPEKDARSAIVERREQVAAFDRPQRLSDLDIGGAVREVRDTPDLYRVWVPEWLVVFTSSASGESGLLEAQQHFASKYDERVRAEDVRYESTSASAPAEYPARLLLRLPNVKGEFKFRDAAESYAQGKDGSTVVARNSREEYALREYSIKKLSRAK